MDVRDAVEADADALAAIGDAPMDVMRELVHDRTVRVATRLRESGPNDDTGGDDGEEVVGFVSYDARERTVHVTQLAGTTEACQRLLAAPTRFAASEEMDVEFLAESDHDSAREAATAVGFAEVGPGPTFAGRRTVRYRYEP
ncbi:MAG: hypothetical protein A07HB70_01180 [uncultured archaeon A07HB70]|jgi:hypothetical protein|nr:MAG: hypothetical protein A07HB70_01180 [uncultured archaeon A07HB70]